MIYFVQMGSLPFVKIGFTKFLTVRIGVLQSASPLPLVVVGTIPGEQCDEALAHRALWASRKLNEWFDAAAAIDLYNRLLCESDVRSYLLIAVAEAEISSPVADAAFIKKVIGQAVTKLTEQHGVEAVAEELGCDPKSVRNARAGRGLVKLSTAANLLALDPTALDPIFALFGRRTEELPTKRSSIEAARDALDGLLNKLVRAA